MSAGSERDDWRGRGTTDFQNGCLDVSEGGRIILDKPMIFAFY